jgi:ribosomal protein S18 acetylase RimI-like enzyme
MENDDAHRGAGVLIMNFVVRQAESRDVPTIVKLYAQATKLMHRLSPEGFGKRLGEPVDIEEETESFSKALDDENSVILVAESSGAVAGFIMGVIEDYEDDMLDSPYMTVQYICVDDRFRKQGVGKALMAEIEKSAIEKGIGNMDLLVWDTNTPARALFAKSGFIPLEIRMGKKIK